MLVAAAESASRHGPCSLTALIGLVVVVVW
jgi:hypothetical protein